MITALRNHAFTSNPSPNFWHTQSQLLASSGSTTCVISSGTMLYIPTTTGRANTPGWENLCPRLASPRGYLDISKKCDIRPLAPSPDFTTRERCVGRIPQLQHFCHPGFSLYWRWTYVGALFRLVVEVTDDQNPAGEAMMLIAHEVCIHSHIHTYIHTYYYTYYYTCIQLHKNTHIKNHGHLLLS